MADTTALQAKIDELVAQAAATEGVEASAVAVINGFAAQVTAAVTAAVQANDAIDNSQIASLTDAIEVVRARFAASGAALGAAIPANPTA